MFRFARSAARRRWPPWPRARPSCDLLLKFRGSPDASRRARAVLVRRKGFGTLLCPTEGLAKSGRSQPPRSLEGPRQVALIAKSALERDLGDRLRRLGKRTGGQVDAQAADALAEGFPVVRLKTLREVHRMDAGLPGVLREGESASELGMEALAHVPQPSRPSVVPPGLGQPAGLSQELEDQSLHRHRCQLITVEQLSRDPRAQSGRSCRGVPKRAAQRQSGFIEVREPFACQLHRDRAYAVTERELWTFLRRLVYQVRGMVTDRTRSPGLGHFAGHHHAESTGRRGGPDDLLPRREGLQRNAEARKLHRRGPARRV